jgi:lipopolysaccharide export system protein LptC
MNRLIAARTNPQAAHAYWTMSRGDSERAFRSARRHSRAVRILRVVIPIGVLLTVVGITLVTYFNPLRMLAKLPINLNDLVVSGTKITMEQPRLSGYTRDGRGYEFTADAAAQDMTKPDIVELRNIHAKVQMQDKSTMQLAAVTGIYDTKGETLKLENNIQLSSSTGYKGHLNEALVDIRKGSIVSTKPVELEMLEGILNASKLEVLDSGDLVRFFDGVKLTVMFNGTAVPKPKPGAQ